MAKNKLQPSVFISYNREDVEYARQLESELELLDFAVWRDQSNVYGGERWPKTLGEAVADSDTLILLWSESASTSDFVELEWCTALALKKQIVPILLDQSSLPASLSAVNALGTDISVKKLADSLRRIVSSVDTRVRKNRRTAILSELESDGKDVASLAAKIHAKADQMSTPKYLAFELMRSLAIPGILSMLTGFAATAIVWDNPFRLDANLISFGAMVVIPTAVLLTLAYLARRRSIKILLTGACIAVVGVLTWFQPRIVAGPVVSVSEPSVVILIHDEPESKAVAADLTDIIKSLPREMTYADYVFRVQPFVYRTNPDAAYITKAIRRNPFIRSVVKVNFQSENEVLIRTEVPALKAWQGMQISDVQGVSNKGDYGSRDQTTFMFSPEFAFVLNVSVGISALDHILASWGGGVGISRDARESLEQVTGRGNLRITTNADRFLDKIRLAVQFSYKDFLVHALGIVGRPCGDLEPFVDIADQPGFGILRDALDSCLPIEEQVERYFTGELSEMKQAQVRRAFVESALSEIETGLREDYSEQLLSDPDVALASELYQECGRVNLESQYEVFRQLRTVNQDDVQSAGCAARFLQARPQGFESGLPQSLAESLGIAFAMGIIEDPSAIVGAGGAEITTWCEDVRHNFRELASQTYGLGPARPIIVRWNTSACAPIEAAPRFMRFFDFVSQQDLESIESSTATWNEQDTIDEQWRGLLLGATNALVGDSTHSTLYRALVNQFVVDYNQSGSCAAILGLGPALNDLGLGDVEPALGLLCQDPRLALLQPVSKATAILDELPVGNSPVLLRQLVMIGSAIEKLQDEAEEDLANAPSWAVEMFRELIDYDESLAHLQKYFPEIDPLDLITLSTLDSLPPKEQLDYVTSHLREGNSLILSAYLAEAYLGMGQQIEAIDTFRSLLEKSRSRLRKDYYATRIAVLTGEHTCAEIGEYFLTSGDVADYDYYTRALAEGDMTVLPLDQFVILLSESRPLSELRSDGEFSDVASAVYSQLDSAILDVAREDSPGFFLRLLAVNQLVSDTYRDEELGTRIQDLLYSADHEIDRNSVLDKAKSCLEP